VVVAELLAEWKYRRTQALKIQTTSQHSFSKDWATHLIENQNSISQREKNLQGNFRSQNRKHQEEYVDKQEHPSQGYISFDITNIKFEDLFDPVLPGKDLFVPVPPGVDVSPDSGDTHCEDGEYQ
jgi:hypothetical protein